MEGKEARLTEEEGGGGRGGKRGGLTDVSCHRRYPGITGLYPEPPKKGELELGPTRNQTRTKIRILCQEEVISLQSSAQAEALRPDSCIWDQETRKKGKVRKG